MENNDIQKNDATNGIPVKDAVRLLHSINESITYRGYNALEIQDLKKIDWKKAFKDRDAALSSSQKWSNTALKLIVAVSAVSLYLFEGFVTTIAGIALVYSLYTLAHRAGEEEAFADGYSNGYEDGVDKALGIDEEEAANIQERANEMQLYGGVVKKWDAEMESDPSGISNNKGGDK